MATTAQRIKIGMELKNLKQADLVEMTSISKGALSSYLSGRYIPKQNNIYRIAKALDVSEAWLMGADVPMERPAAPLSTSSPTAVPSTDAFSTSNLERKIIVEYRAADSITKAMVLKALDIDLKESKEKGIA